MTILTNQKPTIYRNLYENTAPAVPQMYILCYVLTQQTRDIGPMLF